MCKNITLPKDNSDATSSTTKAPAEQPPYPITPFHVILPPKDIPTVATRGGSRKKKEQGDILDDQC